MIYRQDLERMLAQWEVKQRDEIASMQNLEGRMQYMLTESADEDEQMALAQRCGDARDRAAIASGWVQCLRYQIAEIDLEEPPMELVNVFEKVIVQ